MAARPTPRRRSWNAGELSPDLAGAIDIKQYYAGALSMRGVMPVPQAGFRLMPGTNRVTPVRGALAAVTPSATTPATGPFSGTVTLAEWTVPSGAICALRVHDIIGDDAFTFWLEADDGGEWRATTPLQGGDVAVTRTMAFAPGASVTTTAIRLRATVPSGSIAISWTAADIWSDSGAPAAPRYQALPVDDQTGFMLAFGRSFADIFAGDEWVALALLKVGAVDALDPDECAYYAEVATVGIFRRDLQTMRLRRAGTDHDWTVDLWPYEDIPGNDYGATYAKTDDEWTITVSWADNPYLTMQLTVEAETTTGVGLTDTAGTNRKTAGDLAGGADWNKFADDIADAINALPSMPGGVTAVWNQIDDGPGDGSHEIIVTFGGASSGVEYSLSALITNTSKAAALPSHTQVGETDLEPLISAARGWPGAMTVIADRALYHDIAGEPAALLYSAAGEYFRTNIKATGDDAAILDRLRSETAERVLHVLESTYTVIFTSRSVRYLTSRTLSRNQPRNVALVTETPIQPGTRPFEMQSRIYYLRKGGDQVLSLAYSAVEENFAPKPETLLASHMVKAGKRTARQDGEGDDDADKLWLLNGDGTLVAGCLISSQEIFGMAWWPVAGAGAVKEMTVDHANRVWLAVQRGSVWTHEMMDRDQLFQDAIAATPDLSGVVTGAPWPPGTVVWARADGWIVGPLVVGNEGRVELGDAYGEAVIGRWVAPYAEDMPHVLVRGNDTVIRRPGRIHSVTVDVLDTESLAIGCNGQAPRNVSFANLQTMIGGQPLPPFSGRIEETAFLGGKTDTTCVLTQLRPGRLRIKTTEYGEAL